MISRAPFFSIDFAAKYALFSLTKECGGFPGAILLPNHDFFGLRNHAQNGPEMVPRSDLGTNCPRSAHGMETNCPLSTHEMKTKCPLFNGFWRDECPRLTRDLETNCPLFIGFWRDECPLLTRDLETKCPLFICTNTSSPLSELRFR